eukprot:gene26174-34235_t
MPHASEMLTNLLNLPYKSLQKSNKKTWQSDEDELLLQLVEEFGSSGCWTQISAQMPNRSTRQCRERYNNHLAPIIKKGNWTKEEDALIVKLQLELGNQWSKIALQLPGRSDNSVKNRWHLIHRCRPADVIGNDGSFLPSFHPKQVVQGLNPGYLPPNQSIKTEHGVNVPDVFIKPASKSSFAAAFGFSSFSSDATDNCATNASSSGDANGDKSTFSMTNIYRKNILSGEKREKTLKAKQQQEQTKIAFKNFIPIAHSVSSSRTGSLQSLNDAADADTVDLMLLYHNHAEHEHEPILEEDTNLFEYSFPFSPRRPSFECDRQSIGPSISSQATHLRIDSFGFPEWIDDDLTPPTDFDDPNFFNACDQGVLSTSNFPDFVRDQSFVPTGSLQGAAAPTGVGASNTLSPATGDNDWIDEFMRAEVEETISKQLSSTSFTSDRAINGIINSDNLKLQPPFHSSEDRRVAPNKEDVSLWDNVNYNFDMGKTPAELLLAYDERNQMIRARSTSRKSSMSGCKRQEGRHSPATSISDRIHHKKHRMTNKVYVLAPVSLDSITSCDSATPSNAMEHSAPLSWNGINSTPSSSSITNLARSSSSDNSIQFLREELLSHAVVQGFSLPAAPSTLRHWHGQELRYHCGIREFLLEGDFFCGSKPASRPASLLPLRIWGSFAIFSSPVF